MGIIYRAGSPAAGEIYIYFCPRFGLTFGIKLLERNSHRGVQAYGAMRSDFPEAEEIIVSKESMSIKLLEDVER